MSLQLLSIRFPAAPLAQDADIRGEWCYQDNILGNTPTFGHDAVTNVLVLVLYRHAMQNAMVAYPETRKVVIANETWRKHTECPDFGVLPVFNKLPASLLSDVLEEAKPVYYRPSSLLYSAGERVEDDSMLFVLRGELQLVIMGIEVRRIGAGAAGAAAARGYVGLHHFMGLECPDPNAEVSDQRQSTMQKALDDELMEDDMLPRLDCIEALAPAVAPRPVWSTVVGGESWYTASQRVLAGGEILDAFGFPVGDGSALVAVHRWPPRAKNMPDCVEQSEAPHPLKLGAAGAADVLVAYGKMVFRACSKSFVAQVAEIVEVTPPLRNGIRGWACHGGLPPWWKAIKLSSQMVQPSWDDR
eukprot:Skav204733  [mRNA]  locus=scaffold1854:107609:121016:+ [translate_table: standard]